MATRLLEKGRGLLEAPVQTHNARMNPRCSWARVWLRALVVFGLFLGATGCARTHLFYDAREVRYPTLKPNQKGELQAHLEHKLKDRKVVRLDAQGRAQPVSVTRAGLGRLDLAELGALWIATSAGDTGGELDLRVRTSRGAVPVTVKTALDGSIVLQSGGKADDDDGPLMSEDELRDRYRLRTTLPGKWQAEERKALAMAFDMLSDAEMDVVRGLAFKRLGLSPDGDPDKAALYTLEGCQGAILLFSSGVRSDRYRFVGEPTRPRSAVLHALVHEMGHAFDMDEARDAFCAAQRARGDKRRALADDASRAGKRGAVLEAYLAVLAGAPAPTDYGRSSEKESFAESFALFHVDPEALKRVLPKVHAWFAAGGHLKAARGAGKPAS